MSLFTINILVDAVESKFFIIGSRYHNWKNHVIIFGRRSIETNKIRWQMSPAVNDK